MSKLNVATKKKTKKKATQKKGGGGNAGISTIQTKNRTPIVVNIEKGGSKKSIVIGCKPDESKKFLPKRLDEFKPDIYSEFASVLPVDETAYKILEEQTCRGDKTPILYVCEIERKTYLLSDHMLLDIMIKHNISNYYVEKVDEVNTVDKGVWWIVENCNTLPHYLPFTQIKILVDNQERFERLASQNKQLGGKHKNTTSQVIGFKPIDCLGLIAKRVGCSREYVNEVKYILKHGTCEDIKKCEAGKAITTIYKEVKKRKRYSAEDNAAYDQVKFDNPCEGDFVDQVHQGDNLKCIKDMQFAGVKDVAAMIFSPNYNVGVDYGKGIDDLVDHDEYIENVANVMYEGQKLGRDGMRVIAIVPQTMNKKSQAGGDFRYSLMADLIYKIKELNAKHDNFNLRFWGHFDWYKLHAGGNTCQGSISASCPAFRPDAEYIAVWMKNSKKLENIHGYDCKSKKPTIFGGTDRDKYLITPEEYYKWTLQTWKISPSSKTNDRHPAAFPMEIAHRLTKMFTYPQDIVIDPYCGSGTTLVAAKRLKRHYIGIDLQDGYCQVAKNRLAELDEKEGAA